MVVRWGGVGVFSSESDGQIIICSGASSGGSGDSRETGDSGESSEGRRVQWLKV